MLCKVCRSNIDHEKTSRLIGDCLRLLLLTWTIWNLHPWLLMCTLVMDPSHGTLDIFHFEEVIYIFSNIFEVTNWDVSQWKKLHFGNPCRIGYSKAQIPFALIYCWAISYLLSCQRTFFGWELKFRGCGCHFGLWVHQKRAGREYQNLSQQQLAHKIFPSNEWQHTDKPRIFPSDDWQQLSVSSWLYSVVIFTQTVSVREKSLLET